MVTGTVYSGCVRVGDRLLISPSGREARVRGIHAQNQPAECGVAGQRCALNLAGPDLRRQDIHRGDWALDAALHAPTTRLDVKLRVLATAEQPLDHWMPVHGHLGAADVLARVAVLDGDYLIPGATGLVQLIFDQPIAALHGDRFILRDQSARRTLGGGRVLDIAPPTRGRRKPQRLELLRAFSHSNPVEAVRDIARQLDLEEERTRRLLKQLAGMGEAFQVAHDHFFTRTAVAELAAIALELAESEGEARAASFRNRIGGGRKVAIHILEFFDRLGYSRRVGDGHRILRDTLLDLRAMGKI